MSAPTIHEVAERIVAGWPRLTEAEVARLRAALHTPLPEQSGEVVDHE